MDSFIGEEDEDEDDKEMEVFLSSENRISDLPDYKEFPFEERKKGLIQQERPCGNGRRDKDSTMQRELHPPLPQEKSEIAGTTTAEPMTYKLEEDNNVSADDQNPRARTLKRSRGQKGTGEYAIEAIPMSYKFPGHDTVHRIENPKEFPLEERKKGWIQQERPHGNGRRDKYYYHLKSRENCRSLREVHAFIKHGIPIRLLKELMKSQPNTPRRKNGASLLSQNIVGSYNEQTQTVSLQETPQTDAERQPQLVDTSTSAPQHVATIKPKRLLALTKSKLK